MAQENDNKLNNNVHPNSRAARGDQAIEEERAARDAANPSPDATADPNPATDSSVDDSATQIANLAEANEQLETDIEDLQKDIKTANDLATEAKKDLDASVKEADAAAKQARESSERADKLQQEVEDLTKELDTVRAELKSVSEAKTGTGNASGNEGAKDAPKPPTTPKQ